MKALYTLLAISLFATTIQAKNYIIHSGKWTDPLLWGNQYPGVTVYADDVVIIMGQVTISAALLIEGTVQIAKGGSLIGMKDVTVTQTGRLINYGNLVVRKIVNEGIVSNDLLMESVMDIDNNRLVVNNNTVLAGNNFKGEAGNASGHGGRLYANRTMTYCDSIQVPVSMDACHINVPEMKSSALVDY